MNKLTNLIEQLCPDGVEYKMLKDICVLSAGGDVPKNRLSKEKSNTYNVPIISNGIGNNAINGYTDIAKINSPAVTISARGTIGYCELRAYPFYPVVRLICAIPSKEILPDFLKFYLETVQFHVPKVGIPQLTVPMVGKYQVPVPPLEVQAEIVRILDTFTELTTELTTELANRKKQYEYYLNDVFRSVQAEYEPMEKYFPFIRNGFVGTVTSFFTDAEHGVRYLEGKNIHNGIISDNEILYVTKDFHQKHIRNELKPDDILMVQSGHVGECAVVGEKYAGANCHALIIMSNGGNVNSKYVTYYFMSAEGKRKLEKITTGGTIKHILASGMKKVTIPVPPIEEQHRIVAILDRFDRLCNDISEGLPAEIDARKKQYEYYRDKLLTFKRSNSTTS